MKKLLNIIREVLVGFGCIAALILFLIVWGVSFLGAEIAMRRLWPGIQMDVLAPCAGVISGLMALLMLLGGESIAGMISERTWERRAQRQRSARLKRDQWLTRFRDINEHTASSDIEETYWDGIELRDKVLTGARGNTDLDHALESLAVALKQKGFAVDHGNTKGDESR